ncbi:MAG: histidine ammonia-lyase [Bacteriovorax sp. MedPE-SWde]|nr:MAG: histidine ammonia-lyase [Bacteriovorax sp. MedPE-SWde]
MTKEIIIDGHGLTVKDIYNVAYAKKGELTLKLSDISRQSVLNAKDYVTKIVEKGEPVYGINTGFGALSSVHIKKEDLSTLQVNLIRSHCTGVGSPFSREITRAIMLLRANCLASGFSGVSLSAIELILKFINHDITPVVPEKGSVGASGDLAPLSHIALALIGEGEVIYDGKLVRSDFAIRDIGEEPVVLGPKDGLALINGTAVMAALGALAVHRAERLVKLADIAAACTVDGVRGTSNAYDHKIHGLKPHPGQLASSINLNKLLDDSDILKSHPECGKVQDPYSLRCVPQVHGASRQTLAHTRDVITLELNAVTDNPLIFIGEDEVISGGNFHGEAISMAMDYLAIGLAELCNISERRVEKMMNPTFSDLPAFLTPNSGLNSGLMIAHVTAAALTSENKFLCHPASVDSVPTSTDKEDHVSMGVTAGRKLHEVLTNLTTCLSIEFLCNTQALEFHRPLKSSPAIEAVFDHVRKTVPKIEDDRVFYKDINSIESLINNNELLSKVEEVIGELR